MLPDIRISAKHRMRMKECASHRRNGRKLMEIGKIYGITRERVRQLLARYEITQIRYDRFRKLEADYKREFDLIIDD